MAKIEGFRIKNFRSLRDVTLGKLWNTPKSAALTPMTAVIGKNGVGKSTLFDAFGFLSDCLKVGVEEACDANGRGGFKNIRSKGQTGSIEFELFYREESKSHPITYGLYVDMDEGGRPYVVNEWLLQRIKEKKQDLNLNILSLEKGKGFVLFGGESDDLNYMPVELTDSRSLGVVTLGKLKENPRIVQFRSFLESWYLSYFSPDAARSLPLAGPQKHLNRRGDNLGNVVQFMEREHKEKFNKILENISKKIPGIGKISSYKEEISGNLYLLFEDKGFSKPFTHFQMSDGTLKVFAYLLLLEDPTPPPFICIEEPENGLYHKLLEVLAAEFREHATGRKGGSQVFITTHQPYFVDALEPEEVWVLEKGEDGFSKITRANDIQFINSMVEEGQPLGSLWYSDYLDAR